MPVNCTTVARVKRRLGFLPTDTEHDDLIAAWITSVSGQVEAHLGRKIETKSRSEILSPRPGSTIVFLSAFPIVSVATVEDDPQGIFGGVGTQITSSFWGVDPEGGVLNLTSWPPSGGPRSLRITYVGGMATTTDQFVQLWPVIADAVDAQVAHQYRRRHTDGFTSAGGQTQVGTSGEVMGLTAGVVEMLAPYRRILVA